MVRRVTWPIGPKNLRMRRSIASADTVSGHHIRRSFKRRGGVRGVAKSGWACDVTPSSKSPLSGGRRMRIAIIGQQDFGKATLEAFLNRGDTVSAVFCAPEKGRPDPLRVAAQEHNVPVHQFAKLTDPEALEAMRAANAEVGVMAYVTQF